MDVWTMGTVLFKLLFGIDVFSGDEKIEVAEKICKG